MSVPGDPDDIRGWQRLSSRITTSGKLDPGDPARLASLGVRQVVNLALADHPEALPREAEAMAATGITYTHIPVPFDAPHADHYAAFKEALAGDAPVHVHCIMNWRVSAFFYLLHREQGMPEAEARALMAQQWDPLSSDDPRVAPWRELLERQS
ncbi:MAG: protein tyrosine phosphatase family protein [Sphingomonadaceae bacterium]|nr:protein tyrosine phosphatase family protein [Sphingomonadaceae bacterium]